MAQSRQSMGFWAMNEFVMGPLTLSVTGYADEESKDFYKANWLVLDVKCTTDQGDVKFSAPCLMTTDIFEFMDETAELLSGEGRHAYLVSLEPQVDVCLARGDGPDMFSMDVELTPDVNDDEDIYGLSIEVTRAQVEQMAAQATQIIEAFPVRGIQAS
jgi:hypothetical protein